MAFDGISASENQTQSNHNDTDQLTATKVNNAIIFFGVALLNMS